MRALVGLVVLSLMVVDAHGKCPMWGLQVEIKTGSDTSLPATGAIVVAAVPTPGDLGLEGDVAVQRDWKLRVGTAPLAPEIELVAPGLALYKVPGADQLRTPVDIELVDKAGTRKLLAKLDPTARFQRPFEAPEARRIAWSRVQKGRRALSRVTVTLERAAPAGALALVLVDAKGKPRSWGVPGGTTTVQVFEQGRCRTLPAGTVETRPRDRVRLFWIDASGRKSALSRAFVVGT